MIPGEPVIWCRIRFGYNTCTRRHAQVIRRTPRGLIRIRTEDGREHVVQPDNVVRPEEFE